MLVSWLAVQEIEGTVVAFLKPKRLANGQPPLTSHQWVFFSTSCDISNRVFRETSRHLQPFLWRSKHIKYSSQEVRPYPILKQNRYLKPNHDVSLTLTTCFLYLNLSKAQAQHFDRTEIEDLTSADVKLQQFWLTCGFVANIYPGIWFHQSNLKYWKNHAICNCYGILVC